MPTEYNIKNINPNTFSQFSYSKIEHFNYFQENNIDQIIYGQKILPQECDVKKYQNMLVYSFVTENLTPGDIILEIGNSDSQVTTLLKSKGYKCWSLGFKFNLSDNKDDDSVTIDWVLKNDSGETVENLPKKFFDFSFSISAFVSLPETEDAFKLFLNKIKSLIKPVKYSLFNFLTIFNKDNVIWHNQFLNYIYENVTSINEKVLHSQIKSDKNIFLMSEYFFNNFWKATEGMTYENNGKLSSYSILWQNNDMLKAKGFQEFTFSKNSHFNIFNEMGYSKELYGSDISKENRDIKKYQELLLFSYVKNNLIIGSNILIIGVNNSVIAKHLSNDYNIFFLEEAEVLTRGLITTDSRNSFSIIDHTGNKIKFFPVKYFDFIFSFNDFNNSQTSLKEFEFLEFNIYILLSAFGFSLFSFTEYFYKENHKKNELIKYLFKYIEKINNFENYKKMFEDKDLFSQSENNYNFSIYNPEVEVSKVCYNILWKYQPLLPAITKSKPSESLKARPAYFFHHLMKCGGTSVVYTLHKWFNIIFDHYGVQIGVYTDLNDYHRYKLKVDSIYSDTCIVAHFQHEGSFLTQRYPEVLTRPDEFRAFMFVREPLGFVISLYYYGRKSIKSGLEKYLNAHSNFLASLIPCNMSNYKEVIDSYFFVGIVEKMQESFDKLADISGKPRIILPFANKSKKDDQVLQLSSEFIKKFKENNKLDYLIYNYCLEKLEKY